jgi:hypothetical protein
MAAANLAWEALQLPLYTLWSTGTPAAIAWAWIHCTAGDVSIAAAAFLLARACTRGRPRWIFVALLVLSGVAYTIFSEWLNVAMLGRWAYTPAMPLVPPFSTGLAPLLQWVVLPPVALSLAAAVTENRA